VRRLIYVALALILLTLSGLTWLRISRSHACIARAQFAQIHEGMSREQVLALMADAPGASCRLSESYDVWLFGENYCISVEYDRVEPHGGNHVVERRFDQVAQKSPLDRMLEAIGYPESVVFAF